MVARDDLVSKFSRSMPERVAQGTELWLDFEQGKTASLATLRRLLHTLKGEAHMLDLDQCGELAERAETLVDVLLRAGRPTPLTGDALLGALEGMAMLAADPYAEEKPDLTELVRQIQTATDELRANAATGAGPVERQKPSKPEAEAAPPAGAGERKTAASTVGVEVLRPLIHELRRLYAEQTVFHERLREAQRMLRALLVEIDPHRGAETLVERVTKTLGYGSEVDRRLSKIRAEWSGNDFAASLRLDELEDAVRKASVVGTDRLLNQVVRVGRITLRTLGKDAEIRVHGSAILDMSIEQRLEPSLLHLIRNAIDHGIESAELRVTRGKPARATIEVAITQTESSIHVEVSDDGGGVDTARLRQVLASRVADVQTLTDDELLPYLLEQGVTTSEHVTRISGRGVGLDVVAREVALAGGQIRIESKAGIGTRVLLDLPATPRGEIAVPLLAGNARFAVPSRAVHSVVRIENLEHAADGRFLRFTRDDDTQLVRLFTLGMLNGDHTPPKLGTSAVVLYRSAGLFAVAVDGYDTPRPISLQRTEELPFRSSLVRGVSPTPDGEVMLLLDVEALYGYGRTREAPTARVDPQRTTRLPRALIVEDAPVARELLCGILRGLGLNVEEASDGRQGLLLARSNPPDVIVTDVEMPHMDGVEMVRELKSMRELAHVPVIVLTTAATKKNRDRLQELGVTALLSKQEFVEERLRKLIEQALAGRK
ncbi:MAG TPA: response regulator [Polyangiaceae bacterium]